MDTQNLMKIIVSAVIGVVIFAAVLVPTLSDSVKTEETFENEGYYYLTKYATTDEVSLSWDYQNPSQVIVNEATLTLPTTGMATTIAFVETAGVRIFANQTGCQAMLPQGTMAADVADEESLSVTFSEGTISATLTVNGSDTTITNTYDSSIYAISETGDYVMKKSTTSAYMNGDSEFIGLGVTTITGAGAKVILVKGTIDDGATATVVSTSGTTATLSDVTVVKEDNDNYLDLYELDKLTFTGSVEGSADTAITYSYFVVPAEVTAELAVHPDASQIALINIIPLLVLVGLVLGVVGAVLARRD